MKKTFCENQYEAQQLRSENITAYLLQSKKLLANEKFEDSIRVLNEVLKVEPGNTEVVNRIAINYRHLKIWDKAIEWYNKLLQINPHDRNTIIRDLVACQIENNNLEDAQNNLTPLYTENPNDYFLIWLQANIWLKTGKQEDAYIELYKAKTLLEKEVALNDRNDAALEILSRIHCLFFGFEEARKYLEMACHIKNSKARLKKRMEMYNLCQQKEKFHSNFATICNTIEGNRRNPLHEMFPSLKTEIERYEECQEIDPNNLAIQYALMSLYYHTALFYLQTKQYAKALSEIDKAQGIFPIEPYCLAHKVLLLYKNRQYEKALSYIKYGKKTEFCAMIHEGLEDIKQEILSKHSKQKIYTE